MIKTLLNTPLWFILKLHATALVSNRNTRKQENWLLIELSQASPKSSQDHLIMPLLHTSSPPPHLPFCMSAEEESRKKKAPGLIMDAFITVSLHYIYHIYYYQCSYSWYLAFIVKSLILKTNRLKLKLNNLKNSIQNNILHGFHIGIVGLWYK